MVRRVKHVHVLQPPVLHVDPRVSTNCASQALRSSLMAGRRVAVIGGGIAGSLCGLVLRSRGFAPTIIDKGKRALGGRLGGGKEPDSGAVSDRQSNLGPHRSADRLISCLAVRSSFAPQTRARSGRACSRCWPTRGSSPRGGAASACSARAAEASCRSRWRETRMSHTPRTPDSQTPGSSTTHTFEPRLGQGGHSNGQGGGRGARVGRRRLLRLRYGLHARRQPHVRGRAHQRCRVRRHRSARGHSGRATLTLTLTLALTLTLTLTLTGGIQVVRAAVSGALLNAAGRWQLSLSLDADRGVAPGGNGAEAAAAAAAEAAAAVEYDALVLAVHNP